MTTALSAIDFFAAELAHETDPADLAAERASGSGPLVIDTRSAESWSQGRPPGAVHLPNAYLAAGIRHIAPALDTPIANYCWAPGATAAPGGLILATSGYTNVRELIGGFEYWAREGFATVGDGGRMRPLARSPDSAGPDGLATYCPSSLLPLHSR